MHFTSAVRNSRIDNLYSNLGHAKLTKHFGAVAGEVKLGSQILKKKQEYFKEGKN